MKKSKEGITLISLIVTIIVLLILAGITIKLTLGDKGIFYMAELSGRNYANSQEYEEHILKKFDNSIENTLTSITNNKLMEEIMQKYTIEEILNNKNNILKTIFEDEAFSRYMLEHYLEQIINSKEAMTILGQSSYGSYIAVLNNYYMEKILQSNYVQDFDNGTVKVPINPDKGIIDSGRYWYDASRGNLSGKYAFDNWNEDTWFNTPNDGVVPVFIGYDFEEDVIIYKVECNCRKEGVFSNISLQGGDNLDNWEEIAILTLEGFSNNIDTKKYTINCRKSVSKIQILCIKHITIKRIWWNIFSNIAVLLCKKTNKIVYGDIL
ncbi:MAG: hypothetical protein HFJ27_02880 [Clostridia bacterium]|nr:hypothetical protein [Clostridia bacterium]